MPLSPPKACRRPGCPGLSRERHGFCEAHAHLASEAQRDHDRRRGSAAARGYGRRWRAYRESYLRRHPLCVACLARGRATPATVVDHIRDHKGDSQLFWDPANHQALCKPCHDHKPPSMA